MKKFVYIITALFVVTLGTIMGLRLSSDAMAVIIGIAFGLLATIPTTIMMIFVLRQRDDQQAQFSRYQQQQYPPVIVVNGQPDNKFGASGPGLLPSPADRSFRVVGQDETPGETMEGAFKISSIWDEVS